MALKQHDKFTANGTLDFDTCPHDSFSYKVDGTFGGGSVEVGYLSQSGAFVKYEAVSLITAAAQGIITCGQGSSIAFRLQGATAPGIFVNVTPVDC